MLYQPKNDDVLFTFFGVSRRIRQRSLSAEVRRRLAIKRKAQRALEGSGREVLIRDTTLRIAFVSALWFAPMKFLVS